MAKVCKNIKIVNCYLDQIDDRNAVEKDRFNKVFKDYSKLLVQIKDLTDKLKVKEREQYNPSFYSDSSKISMSSIMGDNLSADQRAAYES